jgi:cytochrome d ubiquinol oxidase subunit II
VLLGVAVGNVLRGVPVTADQEWAGSFLGLLNPYAVLVGLVSLAFFTMHGAVYLRMKSRGELEARLARWIPRLWGAFVALYAVATAASVVVSPFLFQKVTHPLFVVLTAALVVAIAAVPALSARGRAGAAFVASSATIVLMILVAAFSAYPVLVPSSLGLQHSLTIYNAASSHRTHAVMLVIALVGVPIMLAYTAVIYRVFRGKVSEEEHGAY